MRFETNPYTKGYFEHGDGSNYRNYGDDPGWDMTARVLKSILPENAHVLELGSAKGYFLKHARDKGIQAFGVDASEWAVSQTPQEVSQFNQLGDITSEDFWVAGWTYDAIVSWEVLEHIHREDIADLVFNMINSLKPGGLLVHRIAITDGGMEDDSDHTHVLMRPRRVWEIAFQLLGLEHMVDFEEKFRFCFSDRDWGDRFFVWRKQ